MSIHNLLSKYIGYEHDGLDIDSDDFKSIIEYHNELLRKSERLKREAAIVDNERHELIRLLEKVCDEPEWYMHL